MTDYEKLVEIKRYSGLSFPKLAKTLGLKTPQAFYDIKSEKNKLSKDMARRINSAFPEISLDWLLGDGEMLKADVGNAEGKPIKYEQRSDVRMVPFYNLDVRGGFGDNQEHGGEAVVDIIPWPGAHEGDFAVEISGMSMMPVIPPGSHVLLRKVDGWQTYLEMNILYTLELEDERRLLKEVHKSDSGEEYFMLHSYNPRTPDQNIPKSFIRRVYKVVGIMTNYGF